MKSKAPQFNLKRTFAAIILFGFFASVGILFQNCGQGFKAYDNSAGLASQEANSVLHIDVTATPATYTSATTATISFSATSTFSAISQVQCVLDNQAPVTCTNSFTASTLTNGLHVLTITATDIMNHTATATQSWTVDNVPPTVAVNLSPSALTNQTTANFTFTATDATSGVAKTQCMLDTAAYSVCASPLALTGLVAGAHTLSIESIDNAGNTSVAVVMKWTIDLTVPATKILTAPSGATNQTSATFTFSGTDALGNALAIFNCALDAGTAAPCNSGTMTYTALISGAHTFSVIGKDGAGNLSAAANFSWMIDLTPPTVTIATMPLADSNVTTSTFQFSANDGVGSGVASTSCSLDGAAFTACTSPQTYTALSSASHTFKVEATDKAGNTSTPLTATWIVDTVAPVVFNLAGPQSCSVGSCTTAVAFSTTDVLSPPVTTTCSVNGGAAVACTSPYNISSGLTAAGTQTIKVTGIDQATNTVSASYSWVISATPPPTFQLIPQGLAGFSGLATNDVYGVTINGGVLYAATDGGLSISSDGGKTFTTKTKANGLGSNFVDAAAVSGNSIFAATTYGLSVSTDGGNTFTNHLIGGTSFTGSADVRSLSVVGGVVYAATFNGVGISKDSGNTFTISTTANGLGSAVVYKVFAIGTNVYAATQGGLAISTNGGTTFTNKTTANGLANNVVWDVTAFGNTIVAATDSGLSVSTDGGATFTTKILGSYATVYSDGTTFYASGNGNLVVSTDGGVTFANIPTNLSNLTISDAVQGIYASGKMVYLALFGGGLAISNNSGTTFTLTKTTGGLTSGFTTSVFASGNNVYATTYGGLASGLSISSDGGSTFTNKTTADGLGSYYEVNRVFADGNNVYVATYGGLSISTDGGKTFTNKTTANGLNVNNVIGVAASGANILAMPYLSTGGNTAFIPGGEQASLYVSNDSGTTFTARTTANGLGSNVIYAVYSSGGIFYVATSGGLSISTDGGATFTNKTTTVGLGSNVIINVFATGNMIYAVTGSGLSISSDGGNTFTYKPITSTLGAVNSCYSVYASGNNIYCATFAGLVYSYDGGATFSASSVLTDPGSGSGYSVYGLYGVGNTVYAATITGLYKSVP